MKEYTFKELTTKLDSIHGNKGLDQYSLIVNKEAITDKTAEGFIQSLEKLTGENLFQVDKGDSALYKFEKGVVETDEESVGKFKRVRFEGGVNIYFGKQEGDGIYMNVRRIVLPPMKEVKISAKPRLFILQRYETYKDGSRKPDTFSLYKLPSLRYPGSIKDLLKWLKKKKKIKSGGEYRIWNTCQDVYEKDGTLEISIACSYGYYPQRNLKTENDIEGYIEFLKADWKETIRTYNEKIRGDWFCFSRIKEINPEVVNSFNPVEINITQEDVNEFLKEYNSRFKIEYK